jgi:hypothetical protein
LGRGCFLELIQRVPKRHTLHARVYRGLI